jgi:hypothetical protein
MLYSYLDAGDVLVAVDGDVVVVTEANAKRRSRDT